MEQDRIIELDLIKGITLLDKALFLKALKQLKPKDDLSAKIISYLIKIFSEYQRIILDFEHLYRDFEYDFSQRKKTLISTAKKKEIIDEKKVPALSAHSEPQIKWEKGGSLINFADLYKYLKAKQWVYCLWISQEDRQHNFQSKGKIDPNGILFGKLVTGLGITFNPNNGQCTVIKRGDDLGFSWQLRNTGKMQFWYKDNFSWELVVHDLQQVLEPCNLSVKELSELLECLLDSEKERLFRLEVANEIGPTDIIEKLFNRGCLIYQQVYFEGKYYPVLVKIDKSVGPYEIEFIGPYGPTKHLQDLTVRPFQVVESLGRFQFIIENLVQNSVRTHSVIVDVYHTTKDFALKIESYGKKVESYYQDTMGYLTVLDVKGDLQHVITTSQSRKQGNMLAQVQTSLTKVTTRVDDILGVIEQVDRVIPGLKEELIELGSIGSKERADIRTALVNLSTITNNSFQHLITSLLNLDTNIQTNMSHSKKIIVDELSLLKNELSSKVDSVEQNISKQFSDLKDYLKSEFGNVRQSGQNSLYLILQSIHKNQQLTIKELLSKLSLPRSTLLYYLEKLQDEQLVDVSVLKKGKRGRPPKLLTSTKKLKKLLKKTLKEK